jgi:hypothetical protein
VFDATQPQPYTAVAYVNTCVQGLAYFGLNTVTNLYGLTYDFWTTLSAPPPGGASVTAQMCGIGIDGYTDTGSHTFLMVGGLAPASCWPPLTSGVAYHAEWGSTSQIVLTSALFVGLQDPRLHEVSDDRWGGVAVTTVPEPPTGALVGAGLILLVGVSGGRVMRRGRDGSHSGDR